MEWTTQLVQESNDTRTTLSTLLVKLKSKCTLQFQSRRKLTMALSFENLKYRFHGVHIYEDMVLTSSYPPDAIDAAKVYSFQENDVVVATYPKSGK